MQWLDKKWRIDKSIELNEVEIATRIWFGIGLIIGKLGWYGGKIDNCDRFIVWKLIIE